MNTLNYDEFIPMKNKNAQQKIKTPSKKNILVLTSIKNQKNRVGEFKNLLSAVESQI